MSFFSVKRLPRNAFNYIIYVFIAVLVLKSSTTKNDERKKNEKITSLVTE